MKFKNIDETLNEAVRQLARVNGIPDSAIEKVICCDCGREVMAAHCTWEICLDPFIETTGPHCGCKSAKKRRKR